MTYLSMSLPFLALGLAVFAAGALHARARRELRRYAAGWAATTACLVALTAVFDNIMMAAGFFDFGAGHTIGLRLGLMPVEDFLYPVVGALLLAGVCQLLDGRGREERT